VSDASWRHDSVVNNVLIQTNIAGTECATGSGNCVKLWEAESGALLRMLSLSGNVRVMSHVTDVWGLTQGQLKGGKEKNSDIGKLQHIPSKDDVVLKLQSVRNHNCPLLAVAMEKNLSWDNQYQDECDKSNQSDELNQTKEIERLKQLNSILYAQLIEKVAKN